jgi:hypothetical protein
MYSESTGVMSGVPLNSRAVTDRRAQQPAEGVLLFVVEVVLAPEEDHLVAQHRLADFSDRGGVEVAGESYAVDACADAAAQLRHRQRGHGEGTVIATSSRLMPMTAPIRRLL